MKALSVRIVGGSLAGLFAAVLLRKDGHDVRIYERSAAGLAGRGAGLVGQHDLFEILGLIGREHVAQIGVVAKERIYLARDGGVAETIATPQMQISWNVLYSAVASHLDAERYVLGRQVESVRDGPDGARLVFSDGETERADLVIGADGLGSVVRPILNPDRQRNIYAGYVAWRGLIPETYLPAGAHLLLDRFAFYVTTGIHILGYCVPGPDGEVDVGRRRYNWVWYRRAPDSALAALFTDVEGHTYDFSLPRGGLSKERRDALVADATAELPPQFALAVTAEETPSIQGVFDYEPTRIVGRAVALMGDAAFVVRPHTAMGVSKAAGDAMALQRCLATATNLADALRRYQAERMSVGRDIAAFGRRLGATAL